MPVSEVGDIQEAAEVEPDGDSIVEIVAELLEVRGRAHVYFSNHRDQDDAHDDIHLTSDSAYVWPAKRGGDGLIFVQSGDVQRYLMPEKIQFIELHYE